MGGKQSKAKPALTSKQAVSNQKTEQAGHSIVKMLVGMLANLTPIGRALTTASIKIADKVDHGSASKYLGPSNKTLDMVPGGSLAQAIASTATHGKSDSVLSKFDPKSTLMSKVKTEAKKSTLHNIAPLQPSKKPSLSTFSPSQSSKRLPSVSAKRPLNAHLIPNKH